MKLPWTHEPDAEYIAKLRRSIELIDRFRLWAILFFFGMLAAIIWLAEEAIRGMLQILNGVNPGGNQGWPILGFSTGAIMGFAIGSLLHKIIQNLVLALGNLRSERLLLRYYDAFNQESADRYDQPDGHEPEH